MKKKKLYLGGVTFATMMFFASCSSCTNSDTEKKTIKTDSLPKNPTAGQVYQDNNGHSWVYDAILMRWALGGSSFGNERENHYYYYPSTGSYQDGTGKSVIPPASVSSGISDGVKARTQTVTKTVTVPKSSSSSSSVSSRSSSPTSKTSVFGSTGRGHSISA